MDDITAAPPRAALRRRAAEPAPTTPDPVEIAMELERGDPSPESPARQLLERHVRLVEKQLGLADNERFRARIKALRDAALAGLAVLALVGVIAVVWDAARSRSLAVQAFSVPPELAARGATGEVLAAQMIDRLADLQAKTDSARPADSYAQDWSGGLTVEIPQTGVSLDQALQMLKSRLGRRTVIRGEVVRGPDGRLQLTVRSGAGPAATVSGVDADLPRLLNQAAEAVYAQTQPYRYGIMLAATPENRARSLEVFRGLTHHADRTERGWAWVGVTTTLFDLGDVDGALAATRRGAALDSRLMSDTNAALMEHLLGHEERALAHADLAARQRWRTTPVAAAVTAPEMTAQAAAWRGDLARAERLFASAGDMPEYAGTAGAARLRRGEILARLHEPARAAAALRDAGAPDEAAVVAVLYPAWEVTLPWTAAAVDGGDWAAARAGLEKASVLPVLGAPPYDRVWRATGAPLLAEALARTGELARGRVLAATTPTDSLPGLLARARIAELAGDRREADRWFAEAARQSPSLPQPDAAWGEAKLSRGDLEGALALFHTAQKKGSRWADPLKFEGDILVRQDKARAALKRYAAAAERAPRWGALHLAWGDALERLGRRDDARAKWRAAAGMDLSAADRAAVRGRLSPTLAGAGAVRAGR